MLVSPEVLSLNEVEKVQSVVLEKNVESMEEVTELVVSII